MPDDADSLVLRYLRRVDEKVDRLAIDVADIKLRLGSLEQRATLIERGLALLHGNT